MALIDEDISLSEVSGNSAVVQEIECPEPGLYTDMPAERYHRIRAASASRLKLLRRSPAHMDEERRNPKPQTEAMSIGSAVHCRILEPDRFSREYVIMPKFDRRTKLGKEAAANFEIDNLGAQIIDQDTAVICEAIYDSIMANPLCRSMIEEPGMAEPSIFWRDKETGIMCKSRLDKHFIFNGRLTVLDLKSTTDASRSEFSKQIYNLGYHVQGAMYLDGISNVIEESHTDFLFLAVEKTAPFAFAPYPLAEDAIEAGHKEYRRLLRLFAECEARQEWPGYDTSMEPINLPAWAYKI